MSKKTQFQKAAKKADLKVQLWRDFSGSGFTNRSGNYDAVILPHLRYKNENVTIAPANSLLKGFPRVLTPEAWVIFDINSYKCIHPFDDPEGKCTWSFTTGASSVVDVMSSTCGKSWDISKSKSPDNWITYNYCHHCGNEIFYKDTEQLLVI